jgi:hypothetical protein
MIVMTIMSIFIVPYSEATGLPGNPSASKRWPTWTIWSTSHDKVHSRNTNTAHARFSISAPDPCGFARSSALPEFPSGLVDSLRIDRAMGRGPYR